jgi:intein/homing endonuclease
MTLKNKEKVSILIKRYKNGEVISKIAKDIGSTYKSCWRILKKNNIKIRIDTNRKYKFSIDIFDKIDSEEKAYWLGFLYADGNNYEKRSTVSLVLALKDKDHILKFMKFLSLNRPLRTGSNLSFPKKSEFASICATDIHFSKRLAELGMMANKTHKLTFPSFIDKKLIRHFIRGYFDGDGSVFFTQRKRTHKPSYGASFVSTI